MLIQTKGSAFYAHTLERDNENNTRPAAHMNENNEKDLLLEKDDDEQRKEKSRP